MKRHDACVQLDFLKQFSNALLLVNEKPLKIMNVLQVIKLFANVGELDDQSKIALKDMVRIWIESNPSSTDVELLLSLILEKKKFDKLAFEESGLIRFIFDYLDDICGK